jgi:hypothetical protein
MLPAKGAGVAHRVSGADARRNDQLGGKVGLLATEKTKPPQVIRTEIIGTDTCTALDLAINSSSPVLALCRALIESGHDSATLLDAYRGKTLCLRIRSIGEAAALELNGEATGFRRRHQPDAASPMRQNGRGAS